MNSRQAQILEALEIPIWQLRPTQADVSAESATEEAGQRTQQAEFNPGAAAEAHPPENAQTANGASPEAVDLAQLDWDALQSAVSACTRCALCKSRRQTVFAAGRPGARWMVIGEAPGAEEDQQGEPFVGQAGKLLDNMLRSVGASRERNVLIANVLKCRPPGNRNPEPAEVAACAPYLMRQIELAQPEFLLLLGKFAASSLLRAEGSIASLRGRTHRVDVGGRSIPAVVSYHPAYLLRQPEEKAKAWADLKLAVRTMQP
ncbi:uracil-DNA glycosylase [Piscinibacterium candidicorallinum]|uniref:Type-4 uracil-DNA glycosylase n=1 Tax=Piscinibacterium candidicorallinum TaxID=1793872 RepID=A0ABV7H2S5_9BURK